MDQPGALAPESASEDASESPTNSIGATTATPPPTATPAGIPPSSLPGSQASLGLQESIKLFSPTSLLASIQTQFLGEKTEAQQKQEQADLAKAQRRAETERQAFTAYQERQKAAEQQRVQATVQLKSQARQLGAYDESSAVLSQTTGGDLSEQTVVNSASKAARERQLKEQRARQMMAQQRHVKKGPQPEGGEGKVSLVDQMTTGQETVTTPAEDQDALQRQAEQALGE